MSKAVAVGKAALGDWLTSGVFVLLVLTVLYVRGSFFFTADIRDVVSNVPDDSCYFFKIAQNVVLGKGLSFDGINPTNGFQPLWLYVLLPLAWVMRDASPELYFRSALFYQMIFLIIAGVILFFALSRVTTRPVALAAAAFFFLCTRYMFSKGMETGVLMLCLAALLAFALHYQVFVRSNPRIAFMFGVLLGLVMLARLDMVFLIMATYAAAIGALLSRRHDRTQAFSTLSDLALCTLGLALVLSPYFIYNKVVFGDFMPISGKLKNTFPYIVQPDFGPPRFKVRDLVAAAVAGGFVVWAVATVRNWRTLGSIQKYFYVATLIGAIAVVAHYLNTALFMKWAVFTWHFAFYYWMLCLIPVAVLAQMRLCTNREMFCSAGALGLSLLVLVHILTNTGEQFLRKSRWHIASYEAAVWARQNLPSDAVLAMTDAGFFGFFSQRAVINLDGLVNNMEYQNALKQRKLAHYLSQKRVEYYVQHAIWSTDKAYEAIMSRKYEFIERRIAESDPIRLYRTDEVYRSAPYYDGPHYTVFLIWRLRHNDAPRSDHRL